MIQGEHTAVKIPRERSSVLLAQNVTITKCAANKVGKIEDSGDDDVFVKSNRKIRTQRLRPRRVMSQKVGIRRYSHQDYYSRVYGHQRNVRGIIPYKLATQTRHPHAARRVSVTNVNGSKRRRNALVGNLPRVPEKGKRKSATNETHQSAMSIGSPVLVQVNKNTLHRPGDKVSGSSRTAVNIGSPVLIEAHKNTLKNESVEGQMGRKVTENETSQALGKLKQISQYFTGSPPSVRKSSGKGSPLLSSRRLTPEITSLGKYQKWSMEETCVWNNLSGQRVELGEIDLLSLSESECVALQKIAEQRLRDIDLGVSITVPKDESKGLHGKHNNSVLKRLQGGKNKSKKDQDHVFSIPLVRVVENDQLLRLQTVDEGAFSSLPSGGNDDDSAPHSSTEASPKSTRRISLSQDSSAEHSTSSVISSSAAVETDQVFNRTSSPSTPPNESPVSRRRAPGARTLRRRGAVGLDTDTEIDPDQKKVLESLESSTRDKKRSLLPPTMPQVPYVVQKCCAHILKHGLDVTGIFRIAGSKKRVKQLREEFDHGVDVKIDENYHAHDVAALLKEFIRDLPEALLTRELYQAFISTAKLSAPQRLSALRCLVWLLPMPNRDTLQQLLSFLETVAEHAEDRIDATGKVICGNKMSVANLSVIFGPNLLHRYKKTGQSGADAQYQVQSMERAEESTFVIKIIDEMIRSQKQLFMIPRESHDEILRTLQESDPDAVDFLLRRKAANYTKSPTAKTPTDRPEESDSASESTERSTIQNGAPYSPLQSDMNNNKNNNKGKLNEKEEKFDSMRSAQDHEREGDIKPLYERSFSKMSFTPKKDGSVSFTDEDLNAILGLDNPFSSKSDHSTSNLDSISETRAVEAKERHVTDFSTKTLHLSSSEKTTLNRHQPEALQIHYSRRQAFSLSPDIKTSQPKELSSMEKRSDTNSPSGGVRSRRRRSTDPDQPQSVNHNLTSSSQSEAKHNTSTDSDPWIKKDTETTFSEDAPMRGRLRSGLNVRLNRVHGPESGVVLHSLRIPKNQSRRSAETPSDMKHRTAAIDRRLSKDDMCLTLRSMRQTDIFI